MRKKRILIPIVGQGSLIHIIRTGMLKQMVAFCEPVVILLWEQPDLLEELQAAGIEAHIMPGYVVSNNYKGARLKINYWYQYFRLRSPSTDIQKKYSFVFKPRKAVVKQTIREKILSLKLKFNPSYIKRLVAEENIKLLNEGVYSKYVSWVAALEAEGIFTVTPFLQEVELVARILKEKNATLVASIHSFDNVTKRGWPAIFFDRYLVWNKYNKAELERINPWLKEKEKIYITGAPQFDFHYNNDYCWSYNGWLEKLALPQGKKIILYAGGSAHLIPNEPQYVKHIVDALEKNEIDQDTIILFRCHPLDSIERWKNHIGNSPYLFYDYKAPAKGRLDHNNYSDEDERRLISTLKYSDVHVNLCSTMAIDGSVFNKPQIAPYYDEVNKDAEPFLRAIYHQEHYQPIINSGALNFAHSRQKLISLIKNALQNPADYNARCQDCVKEIATYTDGKSTERVIARLKQLLG
ncbi:MAG TPA: CDP-glycerol glycerophosphotransferase family protein [Chitinophagaceae bacterium]|nr:CDP-glycerol glycerophosphotransferase family protein [Chitinophagaceae bacterium]